MRGASFVTHNKPLSTLPVFMLMKWLLMGFSVTLGWGPVARRTNHRIRRCYLSSPPPDLQGRGRAGAWINNWSFLHNRSSIDTLNNGVQAACKRIDPQGRSMVHSTVIEVAVSASFWTSPCVPLNLAVYSYTL